MQLTRLDRWLREHFVYETHVYTLRAPDKLPAGLIAEEIPDTPGRSFRHRFIARRPEQAKRLIATLKENNQMFTTRVVDRSAWYVHLIAPKDKSITFWLLWSAITAVALYGITIGVLTLWNNPEIRADVIDALDILKK